MIIEAKAVFGGRFGMQLHDRDIVLHDQVVDVQLRPVRQHLAELGEGTGDEIGFGFVVAGKRMRAHHGPIDVIGDVGEKTRAIATLETGENLPHETRVDCHDRPLSSVTRKLDRDRGIINGVAGR